MDPKLLSGGDLAFIGDAYYELVIREYVIKKDITSLYKLHEECVKYVSRSAQYKIIVAIMDGLTSEEEDIFRRGRNYNYKDKTMEYIYASGFEAIIGYLYLLNRMDRLKEIIDLSIKVIEEKGNE
ncbi:MAG: Mini-ribonuclease 3 [Bacilli bacterium]|nr:Mini-ribonuclease 3 [Bacilli bacterium]